MNSIHPSVSHSSPGPSQPPANSHENVPRSTVFPSAPRPNTNSPAPPWNKLRLLLKSHDVVQPVSDAVVRDRGAIAEPFG